jgi:hypothetical protein
MSAFNIIAGIASILGFAFACYQYHEKNKLKLFTKSVIQGIGGNICKIQQSTRWAFQNFRNAQKLLVKLPDSELKQNLVLIVADGQGDASASDRMLINLLNELLTVQEAQFGSRDISHTEKNELELANKEKNIN